MLSGKDYAGGHKSFGNGILRRAQPLWRHFPFICAHDKALGQAVMIERIGKA
jgi:hypothetical protein